MEDTQIQSNLDDLYSISQIAASAKDLPSMWGPLLDELLTVLKVDAGSLMILENDTLVRKAARGLGDIMKELPIPKSSGGISWKVVNSRKPAVITDLTQEKVASEIVEKNFNSLIAVPMMVRDQVVGVMSVFTHKEHKFTPSDLNFFAIIANQAALAIISIQSAEILKESQNRLDELKALNQISKSVATVFDFEETLDSILTSITTMLRSDMGLVTLFDSETHLLLGKKPAHGLSDRQINDYRSRTDEGVMGEAFCKGIPVMTGKIDKGTEEVLRRGHINNIKSIIAAPLKVKSQTLGVIQIFSSKEDNFREKDLRLFSILSSQAAIVVNSSTMYQEIEEERKKDEALLTSIGDGVMAIDKNQKIIHFNKAGEKITGYLAEELLDQPFSEILGIFNSERQPVETQNSPIGKILKDGSQVTARNYFLRKRNGILFPAYLSLAAIYDIKDKIVGAIIVFRDITSEFEIEQMKQELISLATHELRTPITVINGYLDMILSGDTGGVSGETKEMIEDAVSANQRLADLVDDLLNVGRIEQGRMTVKLETVDLASLTSQIVREYEPQAECKNLELILKDKTIPKIKADTVRLRQVLSNLISNAIKYTDQGSVEVSFEITDKEIITKVQDSGIGISKEEQKKLFAKFYRVRNDKTRQITGTGLGLWITRKLLEMMGGKVWLESVEGKGSTFYFSLPRA